MSVAVLTDVLEGHRAHLTPLDEAEIIARLAEDADLADAALRTCSCGARIHGFYEYLDHLKAAVAAAALAQ